MTQTEETTWTFDGEVGILDLPEAELSTGPEYDENWIHGWPDNGSYTALCGFKAPKGYEHGCSITLSGVKYDIMPKDCPGCGNPICPTCRAMSRPYFRSGGKILP